MQKLQNMTTTLLDPNIRSQGDLYRFTEQLASGLLGLQGNALLLLKTGIPTPSAGIVLPRALRKQMRVQFYVDDTPDSRCVRHVRPATDQKEAVATPQADAGGPMYRIRISRLPIPQKHKAISRLGF